MKVKMQGKRIAALLNFTRNDTSLPVFDHLTTVCPISKVRNIIGNIN